MIDHSPSKTIAIVSSCTETWGGSEELWARSIPYYQKAGYKVVVMKFEIDFAHKKFIELRNNEVALIQLNIQKTRLKRIIYRNWQKIKKEFIRDVRTRDVRTRDIFEKPLEEVRPAMVIISQGINFDGLGYGCVCARLHIPYVLVCQKAVDFFWPNYFDRPFMTESLKGAMHCYFVSQHNKRLTEEQFGIRLENSRVIFNPVKVQRDLIPYPSSKDGIRLACIGRLFLLDKGQDMILRVLSQEKWRNRELSVSFFGTGVDEEGLKAMAAYLKLDKVHFKGYTDHVEDVWKDHHALLLPSRSEGMPLVLLEAMSLGRIGIVTNAGGNAEILEDGVSGFTGTASEAGIEDALERAWSKKESWEDMGRRAALHIKKTVPLNPEQEFANAVIKSIP